MQAGRPAGWDSRMMSPASQASMSSGQNDSTATVVVVVTTWTSLYYVTASGI